MRARTRRFGMRWGLVLVVAAGACSSQQADERLSESTDPQSVPSPESEVVAAYTAAFNAHDVAAMRALMTEDIVWLSIVGDSTIVEARGAEELVSGLTAYFADFPNVSSTVKTGDAAGAYIHAHETASWSSDGVRSSQSSLSTYEIRGGRVARVWYFPSS